MLKKVITVVAVIAVLGLMSVAAASATERARVRDDVAKTSAGLQVMEATQLQQQIHAQDPAIGEDAARIRTGEQAHVQVQAQVQDPPADPVTEQTRTRTQTQLMTQDSECTDCDGPDPIRSQARLHQDAAANPASNRNSAGNAGPNGDGTCDGSGLNGDGTCDGTGPSGSQGSGGARAGWS